jgi:hypothetical protein
MIVQIVVFWTGTACSCRQRQLFFFLEEYAVSIVRVQCVYGWEQLVISADYNKGDHSALQERVGKYSLIRSSR